MPLKSFLASLAVCMLFFSSLVRADDCSDALIAESCASLPAVRSERKQLDDSDKASPSNRESGISKSAKTQVASHRKVTVAPSDKLKLQK